MPSSVPGGATAVVAAAEALPFGVAITDPHGIVTWANPAYARLTGCTPDELLGQSAGTFPFDELSHAAPSSEPWRGRGFCSRKTDEVYTEEYSITTIRDSSDEVTGFWIMKRDTTGLKREIPWPYHAEANLSALIESTEDIIWSVDLNYRLMTFNKALSKAFERSFGVRAAAGMGPEDLLPPERAVLFPPLYERVLSEGPFRAEYLLLDGRTLELSFNPIVQGEETTGVSVFGKDITERKAADAALREAETKYRSIFENAPEGMYRTTLEGRSLAANPALARMLGYDSAQNLVFTITDTAHQLWFDPNERSHFFALLNEQKIVRNYECQFKRKDGNAIWVSVNIRKVSGSDGQTAYYDGFIEDITERKRMEEKLRRSEEKFAKLFLCSPAITILFTPEAEGNRIADVNEAFEQSSGYRREEVVGRTTKELELWAVPNDFDEFMNRFRAAGRLRNFEHDVRRKNGEIGTGLTSAELVELDGLPWAISATIDITEQKRAEANMRSLATAIEQAGETIVITDLSGAIQYCNPAFEKVTGYSRQEVIGQNPRFLKSGKHHADFYAQLWGTITEGRVWSGRLINKKKDGFLYEEDATISPIRDASGKISGFVAVKRDVTEWRQLEDQLRQAQKLESIGRLAGGVAHDFNNLLTVINGYSGLLLKRLKAGDPLRAYADEISIAGERAASLTKQLLAFSRKQMIEPKVLDLNAAIRASAPMLQRLIGEDVTLETHLESSVGPVMADADQVHQVIMNLAVNARDAMPDGGKLEIETKNVELGAEATTAIRPDTMPGRYVVMIVTDHGRGMDETTRQHIFEPFFTTKELGKGTGLGLATVYGIMRQSGGWIDVFSEVGVGSSLKVYFPRVDSCSVPERNEISFSTIGGSETILVVEDEVSVRSFAVAALKQQGYQVLEAPNGKEAIACQSNIQSRFTCC